MKSKLITFMKHSDRGFKNVVDVIICIMSDYPNGITKQTISDVLGGDMELLHPIELDALISLSKSFAPHMLNGLTMEEYASHFYILTKGLMLDSVPGEAVFCQGEWRLP